MLKQYLERGCTNSFFFGITSVLAKGMWLICMPYIISKLSVTDLGIFDYYQSIFLIGSLMITSLSAQPLGRFYLKYRDDVDLQQRTVGTSVTIVLVCALLCLGVSALALMRYTFYGDSYFVMFLMFNAGLYSCFSYVTFFAQIREQLKEYMLLYCAQSFLALGLALTSLRYGYGLSSLFWANGISYLLCTPALVTILSQSGPFEKQAAHEQLSYGMPLMAYNMVYMLLFAVDRWYLATTFGYEMVGLYAVLWYFGRMFVYATMALYDASPMLFYNAQHEQEGMYIMARVIRYVTLLYVTGALMVVPCAYVILSNFLPLYAHLVWYVPLFMVPLLLVETGRFWQTGFMLATKTNLIPAISLITLMVQLALLYTFGHFGLPGVMCANGIAFGCYALMNGMGSAYVYNKALFDGYRLLVLFGLYAIYNLLFWYALYSYLPILSMFLIGLTWPAALWFSGVMLDDEKAHILQICKKILACA